MKRDVLRTHTAIIKKKIHVLLWYDCDFVYWLRYDRRSVCSTRSRPVGDRYVVRAEMSHGTRSQFHHLLAKAEDVSTLVVEQFRLSPRDACLTSSNTFALVSVVRQVFRPKVTLLHRSSILSRMTCICHMVPLCNGSIGDCSEVRKWT